MKSSWVFSGLVLYVLLAVVIFPFFIGIPINLLFDSDAISYSRGAINILLHGFYSLDGLMPFMDREPGMSFFLAFIYAVFGIENPVGFSFAQLIILFFSAWYFCAQASRVSGQRAAGICFLLLLTSGSVFHTVFSAYRECLALSLLMIFSGLFLSCGRSCGWWKSVFMGLIFGCVILTYYSFIFFPPVLLLVFWMKRLPLRYATTVLLVCYSLVGLWALRNFSYDGHFRVISSHRTAIMWYVRGEQAENLKGIEPFKCLFAEYVSRDWTGLARECSFNGLMHEKWPEGADVVVGATDVTRIGQAKIRAHIFNYLWFSAVDTIELHLPFLGGGWSHAYNIYAALTMFVMYVGFFLGIPSLLRRENIFFVLLIGYNTAIFILTDATPRYLLPVIFCYTFIAGIGYDKFFSKVFRR